MSIDYTPTMHLLKNDRFYLIEGERARFLTEVGKEFLGNYPIATFTMPDGTQYRAWKKILSTKVEYNKPFPFNIEWRSHSWYANLREQPYVPIE